MSVSPLSILIIDENIPRALLIETALREQGHERVQLVHTIDAVAGTIAESDPDIIVIDLDDPNREKLEGIFQLTKAVQRPVAMFVNKSDRESTQAAIDAGVSAYVVDGLKPERVQGILDMAVSRFDAYTRMLKDLEQAKDALAARKMIDRAKGILMKAKGISEDEAYSLLRNTAMNQNRKIADVAEGLVVSAELIGKS